MIQKALRKFENNQKEIPRGLCEVQIGQYYFDSKIQETFYSI